LARLLEAGQRGGEIRIDLPARSMAVVVLTAVLTSGRQTVEQRVRSRTASPRLSTVAFRMAFAGMRPAGPVAGSGPDGQAGAVMGRLAAASSGQGDG